MSLFKFKLRTLRYAVPILLALLFFSLTGGSFKRAPWYEVAIWNVVRLPQAAFTWIGSKVFDIWDHYVSLIGEKEENDILKERVAALEGDIARLKEADLQNERFKELLNYREIRGMKSIVARVIASDPRAEFKSVVINRGSDDGVTILAPVVGPRGLVGKVGRTAGSSSRVILITDPNSAVDAFVQRSRARGIVVGSAWDTKLKAGYYLSRMEYLKGESDVNEDDVVVTSGVDGVFPPGIPIGTVRDLRMSQYAVFREANVVPYENMAELEEVMVLVPDK